jgi:uncharacterized protein (DUF433 family)
MALVEFTAAQAAFVLQEPVRTVKKALDAGPVRWVLQRRAGSSVRAIGLSDLFYLYAVRTLRDELTPKARSEFYEALKKTPAERKEVKFGRFVVSIADLFEEVQQRTTDLAELADAVEFRADREPVLKGAGIEVYRIAALLDGGLSIDQVLEDYPSLSRKDVEIAQSYAKAHPKAGRPYPRTSVKRALQRGGLEALDDV